MSVHMRRDDPLPAAIHFFPSCRELAIQTMRCAITLQETFTLQYTDEVSIRLGYEGLEKGMRTTSRTGSHLLDLFFFHVSLILCNNVKDN